MRFQFNACNKLKGLKSVLYVSSLLTLLNVSATPGIVTSRIGSEADAGAGWPCGGGDWISERQRGTERYLHNGSDSRWSPIIPGKSFCARLTHFSRVFPYTMDSGEPITTAQ